MGKRFDSGPDWEQMDELFGYTDINEM